MNPPIANAHIIKTKLLNKILTDKNVTVIAKAIPKIPKKLPCLDVSGDDSPLRANINNTPEIKYNDAAKFGVITLFYFFLFFLYIFSILCVTKKPPNIFIAARIIATNPNIFDSSKATPGEKLETAIIAPTIITDEIALVTDIKGVCNEGVTLQTT